MQNKLQAIPSPKHFASLTLPLILCMKLPPSPSSIAVPMKKLKKDAQALVSGSLVSGIGNKIDRYVMYRDINCTDLYIVP